MVEAILFASTAPLSLSVLAGRLPSGCDAAAALARLRRRYEGRGVVLEQSGEGWAMRTAPDYAWLLRETRTVRRKLSRAALETLAVIAYRQPVTRLEIEETRGVALSRGTLDRLLEEGWVAFGARKNTPGRPVTFVTAQAFLDFFDLRALDDLPGLAEMRDSGLLAPQDAGFSAGFHAGEQDAREHAPARWGKVGEETGEGEEPEEAGEEDGPQEGLP